MPIQYLRKIKNISQKELAKKLNITPSYLSKIEHNEKSPSFELGLRIAMILDICPFSLSDEYTKKCWNKIKTNTTSVKNAIWMILMLKKETAVILDKKFAL